MEHTQKLRADLFAPVLSRLANWNITADHLTLLSGLAGLAFCPLYFYSKWAAVGMLAVHILLDGIDGPLARFTGTASRKGSFTDTLSDQIVVVGSTVALMFAQTIGTVSGGIYIFLYTVVVVFAMIRNAMSIPYSWVARPRFFVYGWVILEMTFLSGSIDFVIWICNFLLAWKVVTGFIQIRRRI